MVIRVSQQLLKIFQGFVVYGFIATFPSVNWAGDLCENPKPAMPSLSFGMTGISESLCERQLKRARWLGFTSVTLSPAYYVTAKDTLEPDVKYTVLYSCLNHARKMGFDIIFKPMIEAPLTPSKKAPPKRRRLDHALTLEESLLDTGDGSISLWRAWFDFRPGQDYENKVIEPFLRWLEANAIRGSRFKVSIVVATELHRSLMDYAQDWNNLMWGMQRRLEADGIHEQVHVGIDPTVFGRESWLPEPIRRMVSPAECNAFQNMLWTADFYAPSIYGNYIWQGYKFWPRLSVYRLMKKNETDWVSSLASRGCRIESSIQERRHNADYKGRDRGQSHRTFWTGEIGYAGSLTRSYAGFETPPPYDEGPEKFNQYRLTTLRAEQSDFIKNSSIWLQAVLSEVRGSYQDTVNFWITGRYDLFGFGDLPPLGELDSYEGEYTASDPVRGADAIPAVARIRDLIQNYTRERCAGWRPIVP